MDKDQMNNIVAKELSEALAKCNQQGIDAGTVRTGLLTIAIANFVNGIGLENTIALFEVLPQQIRSGLFDKFVDRSRPPVVTANQPYATPVSVTQQEPLDVSRYQTGSTSPQPAPAIKRRRL